MATAQEENMTGLTFITVFKSVVAIYKLSVEIIFYLARYGIASPLTSKMYNN